MATSNRRRDVLARLNTAYGGKMYLCVSELSRKLGFDRQTLANRLDRANVPRMKNGRRKEYTQEDIRGLAVSVGGRIMTAP